MGGEEKDGQEEGDIEGNMDREKDTHTEREENKK